ncbi:MAG: Gfo/Idh/MocA family oxidoreductase [Clostridiaceae bacterium]|nr:Gfo/Idh/MocA family oxidoreductase [Clostridiaceae bacterium]
MSAKKEKLHIVLVGCGRIATLHVLGYENNPDAELYGVCDKDIKKAEQFAKTYGVEKVYKSYEEVLIDKAVDAVEILVPHHLHCEMTVKACEAGKHVSVQKPMAMNLAQCDEMIAAADRNGVKLKVFENFVFYPPYQFAKTLLDRGEIGEPVSVRYKMNNAGLGSVNQPNPEGRAKKAGVELTGELKETGWKIDPKSWLWRLNDTLAGGGPLVFDDGYHKFSIILYMLGEVEKVSAWIDSTQVLPGIYQDCPAAIMWKHRDSKIYGIMDIVDSKDMYIQSKYYTCDERMEITGSRGIIWVTRCTGTLLPTVAPVVMYRDGKLSEYWDMPVDWGESFKSSTLDFIDAIKNDREPVLNGKRGREVLRFSLAAIDSSVRKQEVHLDYYEDKEIKKEKGILHIWGKRNK